LRPPQRDYSRIYYTENCAGNDELPRLNKFEGFKLLVQLLRKKSFQEVIQVVHGLRLRLQGVDLGPCSVMQGFPEPGIQATELCLNPKPAVSSARRVKARRIQGDTPRSPVAAAPRAEARISRGWADGGRELVNHFAKYSAVNSLPVSCLMQGKTERELPPVQTGKLDPVLR